MLNDTFNISAQILLYSKSFLFLPQGVNGDGISWYYVRVATVANANKTGYVSTGCVTLDAVSTGYATLD